MAPQASTVASKNPSLARDLLMLGDVYLTLGWLAIQRLRYGPLWPWDATSHRRQNGHTPKDAAEPTFLRRD